MNHGAFHLSRRAVLAAALLSPFASAAGVRHNLPRWFEDMAVNAFCLRTRLIADFPGTLQRIRRQGFRRLELVSFRGWDNHPYGSFTKLAGMSGQDVARALRYAGLEARSSHVLPRELTAAALHVTLGWMKPIGVHTLIMAGLPHGPGQEDALLQAFDGLNEVGRQLADSGCKLMVHGDFSIWQRRGPGYFADEFVRRVDPALCRLQFDIGAVLQMQVDPLEALTRYSGHIGSIHLRDGKPPFEPDVYLPASPLGQGVAPLPQMISKALSAGIEDFVLEMVLVPGGGEFEALSQSRSYLSERIGRGL